MEIINPVFTKKTSVFLKQKKVSDFHVLNLAQNFSLGINPITKQMTNHKSLKITIITETWVPEINGVANSLLNLCLGLQAQGHKIQLIRPKPKTLSERFKPEHECWVRAQSIPKYKSLQFGWPQVSKISNALDRFEPDVVHIVTEGPLGLASLFVAKSKGIPISSGFHSAFHEFSRYFEFPFLVKPISHYLKWFHNRTQITCVPSQDTATALSEMGIVGELRVVGRGVDTTLFNASKRSEDLRKSWGVSDQTRVLLSVGRLSPEKEVGLIVESYKQMQANAVADIKLVIVGDGPDEINLKHLAKDSDVIFTGSLVGEALAEAYASADVFIFPSQVETFGNVALEALASGLPVVAYDYACAKLHVQQQRTGWLIPFGDLSQMKQAIENIPDIKTLHQMGLAAGKNVARAGWLQPASDFEQALIFATQHFTYAVKVS